VDTDVVQGLRAPEDRRGPRRVQPVPGAQDQDLGVGFRQGGERGQAGVPLDHQVAGVPHRQVALVTQLRDAMGDRLAAATGGELFEPMIACDSQQPRQRIALGNLIELAPRRQERLVGDVLRDLTPTVRQRVAQHFRVVAPVDGREVRRVVVFGKGHATTPSHVPCWSDTG
jgi:hypothetical protein